MFLDVVSKAIPGWILGVAPLAIARVRVETEVDVSVFAQFGGVREGGAAGVALVRLASLLAGGVLDGARAVREDALDVLEHLLALGGAELAASLEREVGDVRVAGLARVLLEEGVVGGEELRDGGEGELLGFHGAPLGGDGLGGGGGGDRGESGNLVEARGVVMGGGKAAAPPADALSWAASLVRLRGGRERAGRVYPRALVSAGGIPEGVVVREVETAGAAHLRGGGDELPGEHALRAGLGLSVGHRDEHARGNYGVRANSSARDALFLGDQSKS